MAKRCRRLLPILPSVLVFLSVMLPLAALGGAAEVPEQAQPKIPSMDLVDLKGNTVPLDWSSGANGSAILFFFEPRSAEGLLEMTFLDKVYPKFKDRNVQIVAIEASGLAGKEVDEALERYRRLYPDPAFPIIADPEYRLSKMLGVSDIPSTFIVGPMGNVLSRIDGFSKNEKVELTKKIAKLLHAEGDAEKIAQEWRASEISKRDEEKWPWEKQGPLVMLKPGEKVNPMKMTDLDGKSFRVNWASGNTSVHVVFFWGAMCLPCMREMAYLEEIHRKAKGLGLAVYAIQASALNPARTAVVMERYQRFHRKPDFPIVIDPDGRLRTMFGVKEGGPATFFVDTEGTVTFALNDFAKGYENTMTRKIELALNLPSETLRMSVREIEENLNYNVSKEETLPSLSADAFSSNLTEGDYYFRIWKYDEALPYYLRAIAIDPTEIRVLVNVGHIYERQGKFEEALKQWESVLKLDGEHKEAREHLTSIRERLDKGELRAIN